MVMSLAASGVYVFNDIVDVDLDRQHPYKKHRPLASGVISIQTARILFILLFTASILLAQLLSPMVSVIAVLYVIINIVYTLWLKHVVLVDVGIIAIGFVLRVMLGAVAIDVVVSGWLLLTTLYLALVMALGKRRHELIILGDSSDNHRRSLSSYSGLLLDQLLIMCATASVITYGLYTMSPTVIVHFNTENLVYTVPLAVFGVFRYLYLVYGEGRGGEPSRLLFADPVLLLSVLTWGFSLIVIIYL